jgi:putative ABC transport system permease protein
MSYALAILWYEKQRFLPAILAVAFSALLVAVQCGLLLGMIAFASIPIDHSHADIWVGGPDLVSVDRGPPIPASNLARLMAQPEVELCEICMQSFAYWTRLDGSTELCMVIGSRLADGALGAVRELTPDLRTRLIERGSVVVDASDLQRLGIRGVGDVTEIGGRRVRVVGLVHGLRSFIGAYVFCSIETARTLLHLSQNQTIFLLARCRRAADAPAVVARLRTAYPDLSAFTSTELSARSRWQWLVMTKAGIALGLAATLGLLVGAIICSQTLYAATVTARTQYAVLAALGIPRRQMAALVLAQSFVVGVAGTLLALPVSFALAWCADALRISVQLPAWLLAGTATITLTTALLSSLTALHLVRRIEPATLLR